MKVDLPPLSVTRLALSPAQREFFQRIGREEMNWRRAVERARADAQRRESIARETAHMLRELLGERAVWQPGETTPIALTPRQKRQRLSKADLKAAMAQIALTYAADAQPAFQKIWGALKDRLGEGVTREQARTALKAYAPRLIGQRGRHSA